MVASTGTLHEIGDIEDVADNVIVSHLDDIFYIWMFIMASITTYSYSLHAITTR